MKAKLRSVAFFSVSAGIVVACLWPFHAPANNVSWLEGADGVRIGRHGTLISRSSIRSEIASGEHGWTIELWLRAHTPYQRRVILAFYDPQRTSGLVLRQFYEGVVIETGPWTEESGPHSRGIYADDIFLGQNPVFLTVTSAPEGTRIYVDGRLARSMRELQIPADDLTGRIVVANSPVASESWAGELRGLAVYDRELDDAAVIHDYESWIAAGRPTSLDNEGIVALYPFDEHSGRVIHNRAGSGPDLYILARFGELHEAFLERPWDEYRSEDYWNNVVVNIIGFVPLGFFGYSYFLLFSRLRRPALATIAFGCSLSLTIEILQAFLPTRFSGMTDVITNTLGTGVGALVCRYGGYACETLARRNDAASRVAGLFVRAPRDDRANAVSVSALQVRE